ncbi:MAG: DMT family transporter [Acidimicrobiales bacterium]
MPPSTDSPAEEITTFGSVDWSLFVAISLIWGSSFLLIAMGRDGLTAGMVTLVRVGSGAGALIVLRVIGRADATPIAPSDRARVAAVSIIWVVVPFTLFPMAQEQINSALTGLLNGATPIFVAVIATVLTGHRPRGSLLFGLILGFVGVVVLSLPSIGEGSSEIQGVLMVLAATVCYGIAMNLAAPLQRRYGAVTLMTPILSLATLLLIPVGLRNWGDNRWTADAVVPVLVLGVVGTGIAYWIMATLVGRAGAVRASFITYLIPVVSLVLGVVVRDDRVAVLALVGAALTTLGALLASGRIRLRSRYGVREQATV